MPPVPREPIRYLRERFRLPYGPEGFQVAVAGWSLCFGLSLLLNQDAFAASPNFYRGFVQMGIDDAALGAGLLLHAAIKAVTLTYVGTPIWVRAGAAMLGGFLWSISGFVIVAGMAQAGVLSGAGLFSVVCGIGSFVSVVQFAGASDGRR